MSNEKVGKRSHTITFRVNDEEMDLIERHVTKAVKAKKTKNRNVFVREKLVAVLKEK